MSAEDTSLDTTYFQLTKLNVGIFGLITALVSDIGGLDFLLPNLILGSVLLLAFFLQSLFSLMPDPDGNNTDEEDLEFTVSSLGLVYLILLFSIISPILSSNEYVEVINYDVSDEVFSFFAAVVIWLIPTILRVGEVYNSEERVVNIRYITKMFTILLVSIIGFFVVLKADITVG